MPSGLKGYNIRLDDVKVNPAPVPEGGRFPLLGLDPGVNYSTRITLTAVDNAGRETLVPVSVAALGKMAATPTPTDELPLADREFLDGVMDSGLTARCPGALLGVYTAGGSYLQAYGTDKTTPLTLDHKMRFGSTTKMYTATLILNRVKDGLLSLDDKLEDFVPGIVNGDRITIRHLLQMTSGINDYLQQDPAVQQAYFLSPTVPIDPMPLIKSYVPLFEPGARGSYSNSNYFLLGKVLEVLDAQHGSGRNMQTILIEDCLQPLGLTETEWPTGVNMTAPFARGYCLNYALAQIQALLGPFAFLAALLGYPTTEDIDFTAVDLMVSNTAGALDGTIGDFLKFGRALANGALLSPEMKKIRDESVNVTYATYTPAHDYEGSGWMGFGLGVISWGESWLGWQGNNAGYLSNLWFNVENGTVIAVIFNYAQAPSIQSFYQIANRLHPETLAKSYPQYVHTESIPSSSAFGELGVYVWHEPGDQDGKTDVALKVPFYI
jgi:D-alanyl-D-alanine carboxypeptidase